MDVFSHLPLSIGLIIAAAVAVVLGLAACLSHLLCYRPKAIPLKGAHALITGGSSGIGLATAHACLKEGAGHVVIIGSSPAKLDGALQELKASCCHEGQKLTGIAHDVSQPSVAQAIKDHVTKFGEVDILVASAGVTNVQLFDDITAETFDRLMRVNYLGVVHTVQGVLEGMKRQQRGRIILVSSMCGQAGVVGYASYAPTKFALRGLAEVLSMELCPYGIGVCVSNPPNVNTPMYVEEMRTKPLATKLCDEGSGLFTAEEIATSIVNKGIKSYHFFIQNGFDGWALGIGSIGMAPANSLCQTFIEVLSLGILRFVGLFYLRGFYNICRGCAKGEHAAQEATEQTPLAKAK